MIKPTIGRVVLVERGMFDQREPALVCYVHSDTCINVAGFDKSGLPFGVQSIELLQEDGQVPMKPQLFAEWMPYQKMVAEKGAK